MSNAMLLKLGVACGASQHSAITRRLAPTSPVARLALVRRRCTGGVGKAARTLAANVCGTTTPGCCSSARVIVCSSHSSCLFCVIVALPLLLLFCLNLYPAGSLALS